MHVPLERALLPAQMIRDAFDLAKEKCKDRGGAIIFIDEARSPTLAAAVAASVCVARIVPGCTPPDTDALRVRYPPSRSSPQIDAIGTKRSDSEQGSDREVQRTMLELLNQLDGFSSNNKIKVIAATNRPDILDPALLRCVWGGALRGVGVAAVTHGLGAHVLMHPSATRHRPATSRAAPGVWTARSSCRCRTRRRAGASCRSTRAR